MILNLCVWCSITSRLSTLYFKEDPVYALRPTGGTLVAYFRPAPTYRPPKVLGGFEPMGSTHAGFRV